MHAAIIAGTCIPAYPFVKFGMIEQIGVGHAANTILTGCHVFANTPAPLGWPGPNFYGITENITKALVQGTTFVAVYQVGGVGGNSMGNFVTTHIQCR